MTFEERLREYCLHSDVAYKRILSLSYEKDIYILYPSELKDEQILKDNIRKMLKVIREYINEGELYGYCMSEVNRLHFDSQKTDVINEASDHQRRADKLAEIMNEGISPYAWYYRDTSHGYIVYLDNK